jgi:hypothetical protein
MTVDSASQCTLSALIHYCIVSPNILPVLQVLLRYSRMSGTILLFLLVSDTSVSY